MLLTELVATSTAVAATRSRRAKTAAIAACLLSMEPDEIELGASYLTGSPRQDRLEVGWAALRDVDVPAASEPSLTLATVDAALDEVAAAEGAGSRQTRLDALRQLLSRATEDEQRFLRSLVLGDLRQGALEGVVVQAIAEASDVPAAKVRRAVMLTGDCGVAARAALVEGMEAIDSIRLEVFRPVQPMLAQTSATVEEAVHDMARVAVEAKLDGARVQIHRDGDDIRVYTRTLREVTDQVPDVVAAISALPIRRGVFDGEAIVLDHEGRPQPFQVTMSRFGSSSGREDVRDDLPLSVFLFDCLLVDDRELLDDPLEHRIEALGAVAPGLTPPRIVTDRPVDAGTFFDQVLADGHEGVVAKSLDAPYEAGRRGAAWRKIKPVYTLDLVVLGVEWGSGRREGWLSNLHLGARDGDGFVMLGKTFKGLTDQMLAWQTERFLGLETGRSRHVVNVRPEQVIEIAFDGVQGSSRYPGGVALRFARVKGYREDKRPEDADTIETVRAIHEGRLRPDRPRPDA